MSSQRQELATSPHHRRTRSRRALVAVLLAAVSVAACGGGGDGGGDRGDGGIEIADAIGAASAVGPRTTPQEIGLQPTDGDVVWRATGTPAAVADSISLVGKPDERTDEAGGDVFMLYKAGTVWLKPIDNGATAVVLYRQNEHAYGRHNSVLLRSSSWGSTMNRYRSGGGSTNGGNNFRSGGSSSGK